MSDPAKVHSFLTRTVAALKKAEEAGDMEAMERYSSYLDRAKPVVERTMAQPQPQQIAASPAEQDPVMQQDPINQPVAMPPVAKQPQAQMMAPAGDSAIPAPWGKSGLINPNPAGMTATKPVMSPTGQAMARPGTPPSYASQLPTPFELQMPSETGQTGMDAFARIQAQPLPAAHKPTGADNLDAVVNRLMSTNEPKKQNSARFIEPTPESAIQLPGIKNAEEAEAYSAAEAEKNKPGGPQFGEAGMVGSMLDAAKAAVKDKEEADELAAIEREVGDKPETLTLENLAIMLLMGAPRAFSKIMSEQEGYRTALRNAKVGRRKEKAGAAAQAKEDSFREREVKVKEDDSASRMEMNEAKILAMPAEEKNKALRALLKGGFTAEDERLKSWAAQQLGIAVPPPPK